MWIGLRNSEFLTATQVGVASIARDKALSELDVGFGLGVQGK